MNQLLKSHKLNNYKIEEFDFSLNDVNSLKDNSTPVNSR